MKLTDTLFLSIKNLWRRKLRTFLTVMGVMIGCCAIVIMLSLGIAMERNFMTQVSQMGNIMQIQVYNYNQGGKTPDGNDIPTLDDNMIAKFETMKGVQGATPVMYLNVKMMADKYVSYANIIGIRADMFRLLDIPIINGRPLEEGDTNHMVVGQYVAQNFYNPKASRYRWEPAPEDFDLMEEKVTISWDMNYGEKPQPGVSQPKVKAKPVKVEAVGTVGQSGSEFDWSIIMPFETVKEYRKEMEKWNKQNGNSSGGGGGIFYSYGSVSVSAVGGSGGSKDQGYERVIVKCDDIDEVVNVMDKIKEFGYECYSPIQILDDMKQQSAGLRQILLGIGIMSFIIAAIGIANTMYMSIYERTREIGIIKVIGARLQDIKRLFMLEAWWIGVFGGVLGVALSYLLSFLLNKFNVNLGSSVIWTPEGEVRLASSYIPVWLSAIALAFAPIASLVAGLLPSRRAMKLSVIKALRQD
ncbi:MAG TPA: ABC transporter permease [Clostridiaceae bacterium]|jgi:putative ABC transport system permease protein|nr:ABC transporter permease [Clostridiaceae bacterium]